MIKRKAVKFMNCIIIDDEFPAIEELSYFINNYSSIRILEKFDDSLKALQFVQNNSVDILFLDINMPKLDGMTFSRVINTLKSKPLIVFISAYKEHALEAFEVSAFDYILKPYPEDRIINALKKLENSNSTKFNRDKITLWKNDILVVVPVGEICYCKANEHEVLVYTKEEEFKITSSISDFHKKLPQNNFFKCHRSYIVNLDKIKEIIPWFNNTYLLKLQNMEEEIPVSRHNLSKFKQLMGI